jgi:enoyl-CoA hydratase
VTGTGPKAFAAGADIAALSNMGPLQARSVSELAHGLALAMECCPVPIVAAVNGFALGGGLEFALGADFIYASEQARFGFPEVNLGVMPGFGGTQRLQTRVGIGRARELIYTGKIISATEAMAMGLVNQVCIPDALMPTVLALAETIGEKGPLAVREAKRVMRLGAALPLERALVFEQELFGALFATEDQKEGMRAFIEKRKPVFRGK